MPWKVVRPKGRPSAAVMRMPMRMAPGMRRAARRGDQEKADAGEQRRSRAEIAEGDKGFRIADDHTHVVQTDQAKEESDAGADAELEGDRDGIDEPFAQTEDRDEKEADAGEEDGAECCLPRDVHALHHREGEVGVEAHAGRERERQVGEEAHGGRTDRRGDAGGDEGGAVVDAGSGHDAGIDHNDVGHGEPGGDAGEDLGPCVGVVGGEGEHRVRLRVGRFRRWRPGSSLN